MKQQKMAATAKLVMKSVVPRRHSLSVSGSDYVVHIQAALGQTFCGRRALAVNCIDLTEVGKSPESECRSCQAALARCQERLSIRKLGAAVEALEREHPLPRCPHGRALRDHAGDVLTCPEGCVLGQESECAP